MIDWLRKLFCAHKWELVETGYIEERHRTVQNYNPHTGQWIGNKRYIYEPPVINKLYVCEKCGCSKTLSIYGKKQ